MIKLRNYQKECLTIIKNMKPGSYLIQMATGLGKTVIFTTLINQIIGRCLIISHREELVHQPLKYISRSTGIEMGKEISSGEDVISSCINSLIRRYKKFDSNYFDLIIIDECQHSAADSYLTIINHFKPRLLLGFTATPNRADNKKLDHIYNRIIYEYDLKKGIQNKYLSNIYCKRIYVRYDLKKVKSSGEDFNIKDLERELIESENPLAVSKIYKEHAIGQTLIFGTTIKHCQEISKFISGSVVISAKTKNRGKIIKDFTSRKIKCIINCMVFTEGTDLPLVETIIIARPTKNDSLYVQMVGRGTRLFPGKKQLLLIDCVGASNLNLCTANTLIGVDYNDQNKRENQLNLEGNLFDLPAKIAEREDNPDYWKINYKIVNLWAKKKNYNLHGVNWFKHVDGSFSLQIKNIKMKTSPINCLGKIQYKNTTFEAQNFFDRVYKLLVKKYSDCKYLWDLNSIRSWGYKPITPKQIKLIRQFMPYYDISGMNKLQANQILIRLMNK